jgi:hypothetical protein
VTPVTSPLKRQPDVLFIEGGRYSGEVLRPKGGTMNEVAGSEQKRSGVLKRNLLLLAGYLVVMGLIAGAYV